MPVALGGRQFGNGDDSSQFKSGQVQVPRVL